MQIKSRTFVLSGGASGLSLAAARHLHAHGASVALLDLNTETGQSVAADLGERARFFKTDVTSTASIAAALKSAAEWAESTGAPFGGVVAGAGVGNPGLIIDKKGSPLSLEAFDFVVNINLRGTIDLIRQSLPYLLRNEPVGPDGERGVLIMVSSSAAFDGQMGQVAYAASKGGVAALTLPLARDLSRYGVRAVTIAPSLFESNMTKMLSANVRKSLERVMEWPKREGRPDEFAKLVVHCVENEMLNGTVIRLDGAMRMPSKL